MQIAIVPVGYADGYTRELSNGVGIMRVIMKKGEGRKGEKEKGEKEKGEREKGVCAIVGKISMDMTMIDVTDLDVSIGDEVIVYDAENSLEQIATSINKTPYELLTAISKRVPRIYVRE
jgi:alanine racemase